MLARIRKAQEEGEGGFTLIELLVVIIIIGILAAIAIPVFLNQRQKGYDAQAKSDARNLATLEETYLTDNDKYVVAADKTAATAALGYKPSTNVSAVAITIDTNTTGTGGNEFCIKATSQSGKTFFYDNAAGGLSNTTPTVVNTITCP
jgi:type IV pilus assembly protein PilA